MSILYKSKNSSNTYTLMLETTIVKELYNLLQTLKQEYKDNNIILEQIKYLEKNIILKQFKREFKDYLISKYIKQKNLF